MSARDDARLALHVTRALAMAGVLRPSSPSRMRAAVRAGRELGAIPAASIAIAAARDPDAPAVFDDHGTLTWAQLDARVGALAGILAREHGARSGRAVAILGRNHAGPLEALAATSRTGADALLVNTELPAPQLRAVLAGYDVAAVVCDEEFVARLDAAGTTAPRLVEWKDPGYGPPPAAERPGRIVILTSGTTGVPKGAARELPRRAMAGTVATMVEHFGLRRGAPVVIGPPLFHGFGLGFAATAQAVGAPVVLHRRFDPAAALDAVARHRASCLVGVPVMLKRILDLGPAEHARHDLRSLRRVVSAGAPLPPHLAAALMDAFGDILCNAYGSTETGFGTFATPADLRAAPGTIGRAQLGTTVRILDGDRRPVGPGVTGHVFIGGDLVADGYVGGGSKERAGSLMNTGDLGHADDAGRLFVDGREDDMIVSGGENVFPQEVEDVLATHPSVADVAVIGVDDAEFGQRLRAFVVPADESAPPSADALAAHVRGRLERYKVPRDVVLCDEIPRNATGKTLRRVLAREGA